jgi:quercetin dioxygenase-like cupin family protein
VQNFQIIQLDDIPTQDCPCGLTRRASLDDPDQTASVHLVDISADARPHYHKKTTEIYTVLEGQGYIELNGERHPVKPMSVILIKPGCRHRAVGNLRILNTVIPAFDPNDEWFD